MAENLQSAERSGPGAGAHSYEGVACPTDPRREGGTGMYRDEQGSNGCRLVKRLNYLSPRNELRPPHL